MPDIINRSERTFTHVLNIDVLMLDLSVRNVELKINGWDEWDETGSCPLETANMMYRALVKVFDSDKKTLGWKASLIHIDSSRKPIEFAPYAKRQLQ